MEICKVTPENYQKDLFYGKDVVFDIETNASDVDPKVLLVGATMDGETVYQFGPSMSEKAAVLLSTAKSLCGHNIARFDVPVMEQCFQHVQYTQPLYDTMILAYLADEARPSLRLEDLVHTILGVPLWKDDVVWKWSELAEDDEHWESMLEYNARDCVHTYNLMQYLSIDVPNPDAYQRLVKTSMVLSKMEKTGIYTIPERIEYASKYYKERAEESAKELGTLNPNSAPQMQKYLFEELGLKPIEYTEKGQPSTSKGNLQRFMLQTKNDEVRKKLQAIIDNRNSKKMLSTYVEKFKTTRDWEGRIFPGYSCTSTVTGRTSSFAPNIQNTPREKIVRSIIGARPGYVFLQADASQIELRMGALVSNEENMIRAFQEGKDLHRMMAAKVSGKDESEVTKEERVQLGKIPNFGFLYGAEEYTLIQTAFEDYGIEYTMPQATAIREAFYAQWPGLEVWYNTVAKELRENEEVTSIVGVKRRLPEIHSKNYQKKVEALRQGINFLVQGPSAHLAFEAMVLAEKELSRIATLVAFIHDAVCYEVREQDVEEVSSVLKRIFSTDAPKNLGIYGVVPFIGDVTVGRWWGDE